MNAKRLELDHIGATLHQIELFFLSCGFDGCIDAKNGLRLAVEDAVRRVDVLALCLVIQSSCRETLDIGIAVADRNHEAVLIDAVQLVGLLAHLQDAHLLHQVKAQSCLGCEIDHRCPVVRSEAYLLLMAVFLIPTAKHVFPRQLGGGSVFLNLVEEESAQLRVDDAHGLLLLVFLLFLRRGLEFIVSQRDVLLFLQQLLDGKGKGQVLHLHDKGNYVAALMASTVAEPEVLGGIDAERSGFLIVERAASPGTMTFHLQRNPIV